jgi:hypothetical protein
MYLSINKTYLYYDLPIVFSAINKGNLFICLFVDETDSYLKYLCVQVSPSTLAKLESNQKDIRAIFEYPEFGEVYSIALNNQSEEVVETTMISEDITQFLPDEGLFIGSKEPTHNAFSNEKEIIYNSRLRNDDKTFFDAMVSN